jgi:hypothetical protein
MAARKRRAPAKRRVRRNPRRKYGPSTKRGGRRVTARRAYMKTAAPKRRRARRNPRGVLQQPAFKYGASAVAGAAAASVLNTYADVAKAKADAEALAAGTDPKYGIFGVLSPKVGDYQLHPGVVGGAITLAIASTKLVKRAATRQMLLAGAVGMFAPAAIDMAGQAFMPKANPRHISTRQLRAMRQLSSSPAPHVSSYSSAGHFAHDIIPG